MMQEIIAAKDISTQEWLLSFLPFYSRLSASKIIIAIIFKTLTESHIEVTLFGNDEDQTILSAHRLTEVIGGRVPSIRVYCGWY